MLQLLVRPGSTEQKGLGRTNVGDEEVTQETSANRTAAKNALQIAKDSTMQYCMPTLPT